MSIQLRTNYKTNRKIKINPPGSKRFLEQISKTAAIIIRVGLSTFENKSQFQKMNICHQFHIHLHTLEARNRNALSICMICCTAPCFIQATYGTEIDRPNNSKESKYPQKEPLRIDFSTNNLFEKQ